MSLQNAPVYRFNAGLISRLALGRTDLKRQTFSAEVMTNWMPRMLGSMMLRPGLMYVDGVKANNQAVHIPFVFSNTDTAIIEITNAVMRVRVSEQVITRVAVSTAVTNGTFDSNVTNWTDDDEVGGTSAWATGGYMRLTGDGTAYAIRTQQVTVSAGDQNKEHALRIVIERGPVILRVGSTSGGDEYISEASLETGTHSLAFTPTGNFYIQFKSNLLRYVQVDSCAIESSGAMEITTPWLTADLTKLRWDQSADVVFVACSGYQQRRIERRGTRSWSIVLYKAEDGPFRIQNLTTNSLTPSAITGNITLTALKPLFRATQVGALFQLVSTGQTVSKSISAENTFSDPIRVTGVGADRTFTIALSGTWVATVVLQRSIDAASGPWSDVSGKTWAANTTETYADGLDNQIVYYRIGVKTGGYTSGTVVSSLAIATGSITGVARVTAFTDSKHVDAEVLTALGATTATTDWSEGEWSDYRGWPTALALYEGRLWHAGKGKAWGSVSDAYASYDAATEGDSAPINRSLGSGPVDTVNWLLPLQRLLFGGGMAEISARSTSFDEPLTAGNWNVKDASTQGSYNIPAVKVDSSGVFLQKSRNRVYQLSYDLSRNDYSATDLTRFVPDIAQSAGGFVRLAVQRQPDTRIHAVLADGTVAACVFDPAEDELCWVKVETDGIVEDVFIIPGTAEDNVYYSVKRTVSSGTVRYLERWALESECVGGTLNKQADAAMTFTNSPASATVPGLSYLEGKALVVWTDGKCLTDANGDIATFTVSGGHITLTNGGATYLATTGVVGLAYTGRWKSTKLAYGAQLGSALNQRKKINRLGLVLADAHHKGLKFGQNFTTMRTLSQVIGGKPVTSDQIHTEIDEDLTPFPGGWSTDSRLCLAANAPRPCTVLATVVSLEEADAA